MIILLDDIKKDLQLLIKALNAQGIPRDQILDFVKPRVARQALESLDKKNLNAIAIIADVGLSDFRDNGINFISSQFHDFVAKTGGGVWTVLVSIENLSHRDFGYIHPLPHMTYYKQKTNWATTCAQHIKRLFFSPFDFDKNNDFAPPPDLNIPPADRIYLYSSGDAAYLSPNLNMDAKDYFTFNQVKERDREESNPILMYRGRYIYTSQFKERVSPRVVRVLLRWRTAAIECAKPENRLRVRDVVRDTIGIKHICSWAPSSTSQNAVLDEDDGFHIRSVNNDVGGLRNQPDVKKLETFLFPQGGKQALEGFPNVRAGLPPKKDKLTMDDKALDEFRLPFLKVAGGDAIPDNFLTRLHFVLSPQEVTNYEDWKKEWRAYFLE
jgi:hypothetical protein